MTMPKWRRFRESSNPSIAAAERETADVIFGKIDGIVSSLAATPAGQAVSGAWNNAVSAAQAGVNNAAQAAGFASADNIISQTQSKLSRVAAAFPAVLSKAIPAALAASASLQYTGGQGSFETFLVPINFRCKYMSVDGNRNSYIGRPLCKVRLLGALSGYVQCERVANLTLGGVAASGEDPAEPRATIEELATVREYLEKGCFLL